MFKAYTNLSPKTRMTVGLCIITWAGAGMYMSDKAEEHFGLTPTEKDKEDLQKLTPRITTIDKDESR